jgi:hypothetical protein
MREGKLSAKNQIVIPRDIRPPLVSRQAIGCSLCP